MKKKSIPGIPTLVAARKDQKSVRFFFTHDSIAALYLACLTRGPYVRLSICLSHASIESKQLNVGSPPGSPETTVWISDKHCWRLADATHVRSAFHVTVNAIDGDQCPDGTQL